MHKKALGQYIVPRPVFFLVYGIGNPWQKNDVVLGRFTVVLSHTYTKKKVEML